MKRVISLFVVIFVSAIGLVSSAEVITSVAAKEAADCFLSLDDEWHCNTDAYVRLIEQDGIPAYYVVEYTAGGWAIVSAQSSSSPIIGYNTAGKFASPEPMSELLDFNAKIITARAQSYGDVEHKGWKSVKQRKAVAKVDVNTTPDVAPLITLNLNQSYPFSAYCPSVDGFNSAVGCVAVGMAQAMTVQRYPSRPTGSHTYTSENTGVHSINYDAEPAYDWDAMFNYEEGTNFLEIARLLYHIGVSVDMQYSIAGSGALIVSVPNALTSYFGYNKKTVYYSPRIDDNEKWLQLVLNELVNGRAVIYGGSSKQGGHCWNIDGWKQSTQMVHCNWGWSGIGNGYFSLDNMSDSYQGMSFLYNHGAVFGVGAPTAAPYDILLTNTQFALGTEAGATLAYVETVSADEDAVYNYELSGPENQQTPYQIEGSRLVSSEPVGDSDRFKYLCIKATNIATGETFEKEFDIRIVPVDVHKLLGIYDAHAESMFQGYPDDEWQVKITADEQDPLKVWLQPIGMFSGLEPQSILPIYAIYSETGNTLTMPLGQVLYETAKFRMINGIAQEENEVVTSGDITLQISETDGHIKIAFASDYVFGVGNALENKWWYNALTNIVLTHKANSETAPYGIELSGNTFAKGTAVDVKLADISVACDDRTATIYLETFGPEGVPSPYKVVGNALVSTEPIADSDVFRHLCIKATNALTGETYEEVFDIEIIENMGAMFEGTYSAYAISAISGNPDEEWQVTITADAKEPNKLWIHPVCMFVDLDVADIKPVYAIYDIANGVLNLPLGQITYEQQGYYQMIIGASTSGEVIETSTNMQLQVIQNESKMVILFDHNYVFGIGNAIGNAWWYQALHNITYIRETNAEIEVDGICYNIVSEEEKLVEVTYKGDKYNAYDNEYRGSVVVPSAISYNGATYTVVSVGEFAFAHCAQLTEVTLPASIVSVGEYAFAHCTGLTKICVDVATPPSVHERTFANVDCSIAVVVPVGSAGAYKTAQYWSDFTNIKDYTGVERVTPDSDVDVFVENGVINITGVADSAVVNIYSINGICIRSTTACDVAGIALPQGMYLVQIDGIVRKVAL